MAAIVFDLDDTLYPRVRHVYSGFGAVARAIARRFELPVEAVYARLRLARGDRPQHDGGADAVVQELTTVPRLALELVQHMVAHAA